MSQSKLREQIIEVLEDKFVVAVVKGEVRNLANAEQLADQILRLVKKDLTRWAEGKKKDKIKQLPIKTREEIGDKIIGLLTMEEEMFNQALQDLLTYLKASKEE